MGAKRVSKQGVTVSQGNAIEVTNTAGTVLFSVDNTGNIGALPNLTAKGSLITASATSTPSTLAVGSNGDTLVADSAATVGLRYSATPSASNPVINGAFDVWQRGTSFSLAASTAAASGFLADRWQTATGANQACTISRQSVGDTTNLPSIQYCLRYQRNSGQTGTGGLEMTNTFETANSIPFAGKTVTLSFYARKGADYSPTSSLLAVYLVTGTGTDQSVWGAGFTGSATPINSTATLTTTWQRFSFTGTVAATATQMAVDLRMNPTGTASTNDYYEVTGVQIDVGSVALPFRRMQNTIQGELAACQRYFQRLINGADSSVENLGVFQVLGSTTGVGSVKFFMPMRVSPTISISAAGHFQRFDSTGGGLQALTALTFQQGTPRTTRADATWTSGTTAGHATFVIGNSASATLDASAEL